MKTDFDSTIFARALACQLETERLCGRASFLDESVVKRFAATTLQAITELRVEHEYNTPELPGNKRLDIVCWKPRAEKIELAIECKYVRAESGVTRQWHEEFIRDLLRLERVNDELSNDGRRLAVICGTDSDLRKRIFQYEVNWQQGRQLLFSAKMRGINPGSPFIVRVRDCKGWRKKIFQGLASHVSSNSSLPLSFKVQLSAFERLPGGDDKTIRVMIWEVTRSQNRRTWT